MTQALFDQGAPAPCPTPFNLTAHVLRHADRVPDKTALVIAGGAGESWTYAALKAAVLGTATGLLQKGLQPGDKVLMRLGNTVDFPIAYLAALAVDMVPIPTSSALTEHEVAKIIADQSPGMILRAGDVACPESEAIFGVDEMRTWRDLPPAEIAMGDPNRLGYVIYTSGTSGTPRAVAHAHRAIWARQMMMQGWYGLTAQDRLLHAGAFNWTYTLGTGLMDPWTEGATAIIPQTGTPATDLPALLAQHEVTIFAAAPGVYRQMLRSELPALTHLRHGLSAGEKLPRTIAESWREKSGTDVFEAYGMSECSTFISSSPAAPVADGALGKPQPGRRIAILTADGVAPVDQPGIIAIHKDDPGLMIGYLKTDDPFEGRLQEGWFLTGDTGTMSADGTITYLGRDDDMMNAGGFRVSPLEVEAALATYPGIQAVGAAEVAVGEDKSIIAAFYTGEGPLPSDDLGTYLADRLARYKQPRAFVHLAHLPLGGNGKILRRRLKDIWKDLDHDRR